MAEALRILVVDDNPELVSSLCALLRVHGHEARECHGHNVIADTQAFQPHVVLLDIDLPVKNGWQLAEEIRRLRLPRRPLLIGMSGRYTQGSDKALSQMRGFDHYLAKPIDSPTLLKLLSARR